MYWYAAHIAQGSVSLSGIDSGQELVTVIRFIVLSRLVFLLIDLCWWFMPLLTSLEVSVLES